MIGKPESEPKVCEAIDAAHRLRKLLSNGGGDLENKMLSKFVWDTGCLLCCEVLISFSVYFLVKDRWTEVGLVRLIGDIGGVRER